MGVSFSCLLATYWNARDVLKPAIVGSIFLDDDQQRTTTTVSSLSVKFGDQDSQSNMMHVSCSESDFSSLLSPDSKETVNQSPRPKMADVSTPQSPTLNVASPMHEAAVKLQKVYKSFRTRRKLADCAVLIDQSWWKLLDFAELKHSSISYFDIDKHETAISRWSRARTRAAKVGKGLSKNGKAQKLALQHWLEAIDPRHRYGHNLHFYYVKWLHSQSKEPFFYWLDIGEGREINVVEKCSRSKLQQQCIKYLGPMERKAYEVGLEGGKLWYKQTGELLDTSGEPKAKWIFVLSTSRTLYVARKRKGTFQHSSFLAGGATLAAGRLVVVEGILKAVWPHSGHYRPTPENFQDFISFLKENNVELNDVKLDSADEEEESAKKVDSTYLRVNSSEDDDLGEKDELDSEENDVEYLRQRKRSVTKEAKETPSNNDTEAQAVGSVNGTFPKDTTCEIIEQVCSNLGPDLFGGAKVSKDLILGRITPSCKRSNSCQFLKQLRGTWSTGAGPRIGCLRDYPSELKSHALEEANLSPRTSRGGPGFSIFSSAIPKTSGLNAEIRGTTLCYSTEKCNMPATT